MVRVEFPVAGRVLITVLTCPDVTASGSATRRERFHDPSRALESVESFLARVLRAGGTAAR